MKKYLLIAAFFLISLSVFAQNFDSLISKTEKEQLLSQKNEILMLLFDGIEISNKHQLEEVKWKPNFYEKVNQKYEVEFFYTNLDTIIFYQESSITKAVCIFYTQTYTFNERENKEEWNYFRRYISIAIFEYEIKKQDWKLQYFDKSYGINKEIPISISIQQTGKEKHALFFDFCNLGTFGGRCYLVIYDLSETKDLKTIITFDYNQQTFRKEVSFSSKDSYGYYELIVNTFREEVEIKKEYFKYDNLEGYVLKE